MQIVYVYVYMYVYIYMCTYDYIPSICHPNGNGTPSSTSTWLQRRPVANLLHQRSHGRMLQASMTGGKKWELNVFNMLINVNKCSSCVIKKKHGWCVPETAFEPNQTWGFDMVWPCWTKMNEAITCQKESKGRISATEMCILPPCST